MFLTSWGYSSILPHTPLVLPLLGDGRKGFKIMNYQKDRPSGLDLEALTTRLDSLTRPPPLPLVSLHVTEGT